MIRIKSILLVIISFAIVSCASSHVLIGKKRSPIPPEDVTIYSKPPAKYEEIAFVNANSKASWSFTDQGKTDKVIERLKNEAAKLGANGLIIKTLGSEFGGMVGHTDINTGNTYMAPVNRKAGSGVAIYVIQEKTPNK